MMGDSIRTCYPYIAGHVQLAADDCRWCSRALAAALACDDVAFVETAAVAHYIVALEVVVLSVVVARIVGYY